MPKQRPNFREKILACLPGTRLQITKKSGADYCTVNKWIKIFREEGICHVGKWRRSKPGAKQPVFVLGPGDDAPPPKTLTSKEQTARFNEKNPERRKEIHRASDRRLRARRKNLQKGIFATLFMAAQNEA